MRYSLTEAYQQLRAARAQQLIEAEEDDEAPRINPTDSKRLQRIDRDLMWRMCDELHRHDPFWFTADPGLQGLHRFLASHGDGWRDVLSDHDQLFIPRAAKAPEMPGCVKGFRKRMAPLTAAQKPERGIDDMAYGWMLLALAAQHPEFGHRSVAMSINSGAKMNDHAVDGHPDWFDYHLSAVARDTLEEFRKANTGVLAGEEAFQRFRGRRRCRLQRYPRHIVLLEWLQRVSPAFNIPHFAAERANLAQLSGFLHRTVSQSPAATRTVQPDRWPLTAPLTDIELLDAALKQLEQFMKLPTSSRLGVASGYKAFNDTEFWHQLFRSLGLLPVPMRNNGWEFPIRVTLPVAVAEMLCFHVKEYKENSALHEELDSLGKRQNLERDTPPPGATEHSHIWCIDPDYDKFGKDKCKHMQMEVVHSNRWDREDFWSNDFLLLVLCLFFEQRNVNAAANQAPDGSPVENGASMDEQPDAAHLERMRANLADAWMDGLSGYGALRPAAADLQTFREMDIANPERHTASTLALISSYAVMELRANVLHALLDAAPKDERLIADAEYFALRHEQAMGMPAQSKDNAPEMTGKALAVFTELTEARSCAGELLDGLRPWLAMPAGDSAAEAVRAWMQDVDRHLAMVGQPTARLRYDPAAQCLRFGNGEQLSCDIAPPWPASFRRRMSAYTWLMNDMRELASELAAEQAQEGSAAAGSSQFLKSVSHNAWRLATDQLVSLADLFSALQREFSAPQTSILSSAPPDTGTAIWVAEAWQPASRTIAFGLAERIADQLADIHVEFDDGREVVCAIEALHDDFSGHLAGFTLTVSSGVDIQVQGFEISWDPARGKLQLTFLE